MLLIRFSYWKSRSNCTRELYKVVKSFFFSGGKSFPQCLVSWMNKWNYVTEKIKKFKASKRGKSGDKVMIFRRFWSLTASCGRYRSFESFSKVFLQWKFQENFMKHPLKIQSISKNMSSVIYWKISTQLAVKLQLFPFHCFSINFLIPTVCDAMRRHEYFDRKFIKS